jgi:hypothetical protein
VFLTLDVFASNVKELRFSLFPSPLISVSSARLYAESSVSVASTAANAFRYVMRIKPVA